MAAAARRSTPAANSGRKRLGRGLDTLLPAPVRIDIGGGSEGQAGRDTAPSPVTPSAADPSGPSNTDRAADAEMVTPPGEHVQYLSTADIHPGRHQPRQHFDEASLDALAVSIRSAGIMQPLIVRPRQEGGFELIAGERRWRAAQRIDLADVPAIVRDIDDRTAAEWALIENLQREDLNPMDRAEAFDRLQRSFGLTHQDIADRVGLNRSSVTNIVRLNELADAIKSSIRDGRLSLGHAKALLSVTNDEQRLKLARQAERQGWSVRRLERAAAAAASTVVDNDNHSRDAQAAAGAASHLRDLEEKLGAQLGTRVVIRPGRKKGSGELIVHFYDFDQFEGVLNRLGVRAEPA